MKFFIAFLFAFLIATECLAQTFSSMAIFVSEDATGKPVAGASVIIKEAGWATKTTGSDGKAFFDKSMPIGEIHYIVSKEGYQGLEGTFNITTEEKSNTLNIKLSKFRDDRLLITGEVVDEDERDLEGAIVEVKVADIVKTAKTDASGNYKIELTLNRTQYDVSTLKLEAKCPNGGSKKTETIDLTRRNVIYKDFKINCGTVIVDPKLTPINTFEQAGFLFELQECKTSGGKVICKFLITSKGHDTELMVNVTSKQTSNQTNKQSRIFDTEGNEYKLVEAKVSDVTGNYQWLRKSVVKDVPVKASFSFGNSVQITKIAKMQISCRDLYGEYFIVDFRNIPVKQ